MKKNIIFCTQVGHDNLQVAHQCIYEDCKLMHQQCCSLCITEGIHNHGKSDHQYIRLKQEIQNNYKKLPQLDNQDDENKNKIIQPIEFKNRKYNLKQIDNKEQYFTASISNNERYLAYGGGEILKIYDLKEDKIIREIKFIGSITSCQFTFDSSLLFVGYSYYNIFSQDSQIFGYDVQKNFKKTFQYMIYAQRITDIITIYSQYLVTSRYNNTIVKIDIKSKKQLFKLYNYGQIKGIDYDQSNNLLINGTQDKSLKLWHCGKRKMIIRKQQAHSDHICQIQFINNIQNVLSLDYLCNLYKWKIDLIKNQLIKLQEYQDPNNIYSFQQINQNQNLLLTCSNYVKIVDDKGESINQIDHQYELQQIFRFTNRQLDNVRYIIIANRNNILLASALN